jgi:hypothetical protein
VCTGSNSKASRPLFPGEEVFEGEVLHTVDLGGFESLAGKRVLTLGIGESGSDVPYHIAQVPGVTLTIAYRGLGWCVPRTGLPADLNTNRVLWGLPRIFNRALSFLLSFFDQRDSDPVIRRMGRLNAEHPGGVYRTYGSKSIGFLIAVEHMGAKLIKTTIKSFGPGKMVTFEDGTSEEFDVVVLNTGYTKTWFDEYAQIEEYPENDHQPPEAAAPGALPPRTTNDPNDPSHVKKRSSLRSYMVRGLLKETTGRVSVDLSNLLMPMLSSSTTNDDTALQRILAESSTVRNLYKRCVHPASAGMNIFFVGFARPAFGAIPPIAELQVR